MKKSPREKPELENLETCYVCVAGKCALKSRPFLNNRKDDDDDREKHKNRNEKFSSVNVALYQRKLEWRDCEGTQKIFLSLKLCFKFLRRI